MLDRGRGISLLLWHILDYSVFLGAACAVSANSDLSTESVGNSLQNLLCRPPPLAAPGCLNLGQCVLAMPSRPGKTGSGARRLVRHGREHRFVDASRPRALSAGAAGCHCGDDCSASHRRPSQTGLFGQLDTIRAKVGTRSKGPDAARHPFGELQPELQVELAGLVMRFPNLHFYRCKRPCRICEGVRCPG